MAKTQQEVVLEGDAISPQAALREIRAWLTHKLEDGPTEARGYQDNSGHPHYWTAVLIPDWEIKQKIALVNDALAQQEVR